jgi:hypothetical protein
VGFKKHNAHRGGHYVFWKAHWLFFFFFLWIPTSYHEILKKNHNVFNVGKALPFGLYPTLNFPIDDGIESFFKKTLILAWSW